MRLVWGGGAPTSTKWVATTGMWWGVIVDGGFAGAMEGEGMG